MNPSGETAPQRVMRILIGLGAFGLLAWLLIQGRELTTPTLFVLLTLILAMSGLGNLLTNLFGNSGGGNGGGGSGGAF